MRQFENSSHVLVVFGDKGNLKNFARNPPFTKVLSVHYLFIDLRTGISGGETSFLF